jgi:hypothetical protein
MAPPMSMFIAEIGDKARPDALGQSFDGRCRPH